MLASKHSNQEHTKPYFLQGLHHAKDILLQLRKNKQEQLHLSPIRKKHHKFSNDPIMEDEEEPRSHQGYSGKAHHQRSISSNMFALNSKHEHLKSVLVKEGPCEEVKKQIEVVKEDINEIGRQLEKTNQDIEAYQLVLDHLSGCYRANLATVYRNHKLKRDSLRMTQLKEQYLANIKQTQHKLTHLDAQTKMVNIHIQESVQEYIRSVLAYNAQQELHGLTPEYPELRGGSQYCEESETEEDYGKELNLNHQQLRKEKDDYTQKKVLIEPKQLQKGISFEEEIDVISSYYEAELSNI